MPNTPLEWVQELEPRLRKRREGFEKLDDYYCGEHPLPFLTEAHSAKMLNEFHRLLKESNTNFMRLVVDVVEERLNVEGIRLSAGSSEETDKESWDIWQANQMDSESSVAMLDALVKGVSYLSVWADDGDDYPTIAVEDACETIVAYSPGSGYRYRDAALKMWTDGDERRANVYLPDAIHKFKAERDQEAEAQAMSDAYYLGNFYAGPQAPPWKEISGSAVENPVGVVPIIPLRNRPRVRCEGESELADVWHTQNQINGFLFLLALAGYFGAHKQRWAAGVPIMIDERTGTPIEPFETDISKLWVAEDKEASFGEFQQTDLGGYISAIEQKVLHIAVTTRTPRHYLIEQGQSPSGDAIRSAESGLIKKTERKMRPFGEGFEEALVLARQFQGESDAPVDAEIVWSDPATPTPAETTDAVIKQHAAGLLPWEMAMEKLGYTQTEIARMAGQRQADALIQSITAPPPVPPPATEPVPPVVA